MSGNAFGLTAAQLAQANFERRYRGWFEAAQERLDREAREREERNAQFRAKLDAATRRWRGVWEAAASAPIEEAVAIHYPRNGFGYSIECLECTHEEAYDANATWPCRTFLLLEEFVHEQA